MSTSISFPLSGGLSFLLRIWRDCGRCRPRFCYTPDLICFFAIDGDTHRLDTIFFRTVVQRWLSFFDISPRLYIKLRCMDLTRESDRSLQITRSAIKPLLSRHFLPSKLIAGITTKGTTPTFYKSNATTELIASVGGGVYPDVPTIVYTRIPSMRRSRNLSINAKVKLRYGNLDPESWRCELIRRCTMHYTNNESPTSHPRPPLSATFVSLHLPKSHYHLHSNFTVNIVDLHRLCYSASISAPPHSLASAAFAAVLFSAIADSYPFSHWFNSISKHQVHSS